MPVHSLCANFLYTPEHYVHLSSGKQTKCSYRFNVENQPLGFRTLHSRRLPKACLRWLRLNLGLPRLFNAPLTSFVRRAFWFLAAVITIAIMEPATACVEFLCECASRLAEGAFAFESWFSNPAPYITSVPPTSVSADELCPLLLPTFAFFSLPARRATNGRAFVFIRVFRSGGSVDQGGGGGGELRSFRLKGVERVNDLLHRLCPDTNRSISTIHAGPHVILSLFASLPGVSSRSGRFGLAWLQTPCVLIIAAFQAAPPPSPPLPRGKGALAQQGDSYF